MNYFWVTVLLTPHRSADLRVLATSPQSASWLLDRQTPWLPWWQELILNWVAADGETQCEWSLPSDTDLHRAQLEELYRS